MKKILTTLIVIAFIIVGGAAYSQEPPKLTPEQITEAALNEMLKWKIQYGRETVFAVEMQVLAFRLEKALKELGAKLKAANAKIVQLETKPVEKLK